MVKVVTFDTVVLKLPASLLAPGSSLELGFAALFFEVVADFVAVLFVSALRFVFRLVSSSTFDSSIAVPFTADETALTDERVIRFLAAGSKVESESSRRFGGILTGIS